MVSQTCSCAAAPLFNPLDYSFAQNKKWHFELNYKYHALNDLVEGTHKVEDDTRRKRTAQTLFFDVRYALNRYLTFRVAFSLARQYRDIGISTSSPVSTNGIGDSLILVQLTPLQYSPTNRTAVALGGGLKMPLGNSKASIIGIASEDMQPGTGSWDFLAWGIISRSFPVAAGFDVFAGISSRFNGANSRKYSFGRELTSSIGAKLYSSKVFAYSLYSRFRWAAGDKRFDSEIPNTGGKWIYVVPAVTARLFKGIGFKTELEIPVYRNLNGFRQFSSTFQASIVVFYEI